MRRNSRRKGGSFFFAGPVDIGSSSTGSLVLRNRATLSSSGELTLGRFRDGVGSASIQSGATLSPTGMTIGTSAGEGELSVLGGNVNVVGTLALGGTSFDDAGRGTLTARGGGSTVTAREISVASGSSFTLGDGAEATSLGDMTVGRVIATSTARRVPVMLFGFDQIVAAWTLYLAATGASGQALSVDRWLARRRSDSPEPTISANLALRLIQLHLCVIYGMAGLAKLQGPAWWNGTAFGMVLLTREFRSMVDVSRLVRFPLAVNLATHVTILF